MKSVGTDSLPGRVVLMLNHVAGMLDLVILPLWIGGLIGTYTFSPQAAGGLVTLFLLGVLASNAVVARRYGRIPNRFVVTAGYAVSALCFLAMIVAPSASRLPIFATLAILHVVAGCGVGASLSCVHGTIARSDKPHRNFAIANLGVGAFAIPFFAVTPHFMQTMGVDAVFVAVALLMIVASVAALLFFPVPARDLDREPGFHAIPVSPAGRFGPSLVLGFIGVVLLQTAGSATNSFTEQVGLSDGFTITAIGAMLAVNGFVAILAPICAGLLEKRLAPIPVAAFALTVHGLSSVVLTQTGSFAVYGGAFMTMIFMTIFGHTFIFGLFAKLDPSGRVNAATPSMLMLGTAIGPFLGGTVVQALGFRAMGLASGCIALLGAACFLLIGRRVGTAVKPVGQAI